MIVIDGSHGEGGGQILRTALALSLVTGQPFRIENIRSGRRKPGLMRQHLTAVNAAKAVGDADVDGNTIGSQRFSFHPRILKSGKYHFAVGTAGSCTLVLQTILPALIMSDGPSELILEGGTHNPFAPPFDFLKRSFLALINRMGPTVSAGLEKPGFYPAGGGRFIVAIEPASLKKIRLNRRGEIIHGQAVAKVANLPLNIAQRELKVVRKEMEWDPSRLKAVAVDNANGPGNVLTIEVESDTITEVFTGFGERGVSAENVAKRAVKQAQEYLAADVPVGRFLADQLLVPMAIAGGGSYLTLSPSLHTRTNVDIIRSFLDVNIDIQQVGSEQWKIVI
ncbi:MAG: RNA 3'-terminal phosphate cyclase [Desulfatitalea sp.]|nr:RNA 3'-terminal phosphate cyclase [Desulfatitalea sp.]NNJ99758.1 RNA 3'-terminal phosphate cyclase [Desulfatitalea sp.]